MPGNSLSDDNSENVESDDNSEDVQGDDISQEQPWLMSGDE